MIRRSAFIIAGALWLAAPAAQAQTDMRLKMDAGPYIGVGLGRAEHRDFCASITGGTCDSKDLTWNLYGGYQVNRYFAVEAGYVDFGKATASGFIVGSGLPASITTDSWAIELVAVGIVPLNESFSFYGKLGMFRYDSEGTSGGGAAGSRSDNGYELTYGLGAEYNFNRSFGARLEWQRYLSVGSEFLGIPKGDINLMRVSTRYKF